MIAGKTDMPRVLRCLDKNPVFSEYPWSAETVEHVAKYLHHQGPAKAAHTLWQIANLRNATIAGQLAKHLQNLLKQEQQRCAGQVKLRNWGLHPSYSKVLKHRRLHNAHENEYAFDTPPADTPPLIIDERGVIRF